MPMPAHHLPVGSSMTTLHLCSDGTYLYWVWSPASLNEKTQKGHSVFMDVFCLSVSGLCHVLLHQLNKCSLMAIFNVYWFHSSNFYSDLDRGVCCRRLAGEGYSYSQRRRVFKVLEWASFESNVTLPSLPFCHIGRAYRLCNHKHCQRGTIW